MAGPPQQLPAQASPAQAGTAANAPSAATPAVASQPVNLADYQRLARRRLPDPVWAYLHGAAADGLTDRANRRAWQAIGLLPRVLRSLADGHTRIALLGREWPTPLLVAPMAYQRLAHADGECATALAAACQGTGLVLSAQASMRLEDVAAWHRPEAGRGPLWFQLYLQPDRGFTLDLVRRAEAAGYEALVLTVDAPCHGARDAQRRSGFRLPPGITAVNLAGQRRPALAPAADSLGGLCGGTLQHAASWDDVAWLQAHSRLPLLLKGVMHPDDARQARAMGVAGLLVSNHGGRTLDTACATAHALPRIADAVGADLPLLVDGGIRRGTDVLKALALGARAVLVGRPVLHGLACGGAQGVAHVLRLLRDEFEMALALCGCATPAHVDRRMLVD